MQAFHDEFLARLEPLFDHHPTFRLLAEPHVASCDAVLFTDQHQVGADAIAEHGPGGDQQGGRTHAGRDANPDEQAREQRAVFVVERGPQAKRAGGGVDAFLVDVVEAADERESGVGLALQKYRRLSPSLFAAGAFRGFADRFLERQHLAVADAEVRVDAGVVDDRGEFGADVDEVTELDLGFGDATADRGFDFRVGEIQFGLGELGGRLLASRLGRFDRRAGGRQVRFGGSVGRHRAVVIGL